MPLIAHLSDTHITTGPLAAERAAGLRRALERVLALDPAPDCIVVTGDLVDHGSSAEYRTLQTLLEGCPVPVHLLPGNHDGAAGLREVFGLAETAYVVEYPQFTIVMLDSLRPGLGDAGEVGAEQLAWLDEVLGRRSGVPAFVCVHHPPIEVGIPFMDAIRLADGPALADVVRRHGHVVRVLAGHLHRTVSAGFGGTVLSVAPSTGRKPEASEPTGFLVHRLDGHQCVTHVWHTAE